MALLAPILILVICLTFSITSFAQAVPNTEQEELRPVITEVTLSEDQSGTNPAGSPVQTPPGPTVSNAESDNTSTPPDASGPEVSRGSSTARSIITGSLRFLGTPYRYGGRTTKGFDCSGFVGYVFGLFDIKLPRSSREQASVGTHVDKDSLIPADLVFFKTGGSSRINHVGIYLGDSRFIHASSTRGVVITSLNDKYYKKAYYGARRVLGN